MNSLSKILLVSMLALTTGCFTRSSTPLLLTTPPTLSDDLNLDGIIDGVRASMGYLGKTGDKEMRFGEFRITRSEYARSLAALDRAWSQIPSEKDRLAYIRDNFVFLRSEGATGRGKILLTGYFEPILLGSKSPTDTFSQPLYKRPGSLLELRLNKFSPRFVEEPSLRARAEAQEVLPYFTRAEIDGAKVLAGKELEIAWVDPIDAFFLHIQGSGTVQLPDGREIYLNYAEKNGHRYEAIGKFIKEKTGQEKITMEHIVSYLRRVPVQERDEILFKNPSYVFFRESHQRATTASGIPAVSGRSIATDPAIFPKGALAFLTFQNPIDHSRTSRLVLDHDTGGAIKGAGRVDLFCGRGESAKQFAGPLQDSDAEIYYLFPREYLP